MADILNMDDLKNDNVSQNSASDAFCVSKRISCDLREIPQTNSDYGSNSSDDYCPESAVLVGNDKTNMETSALDSGIAESDNTLQNLTETSNNTREEKIKLSKICNQTCMIISAISNVMLIIAISTVLAVFYLESHNEATSASNESNLFCVLENQQKKICANHSANHLQYLIHMMQTRLNNSKLSQTNIVQANVHFKKLKGHNTTASLTLRKSKHRPRTVQKILIKEKSSFLISQHLVFKKESRWNHINQRDVRVSVRKENGNGSANSDLLVKTLRVLHGSQTLQVADMMGTFYLEPGDQIAITVSVPSLLYKCKPCNKLIVMKSA